MSSREEMKEAGLKTNAEHTKIDAYSSNHLAKLILAFLELLQNLNSSVEIKFPNRTIARLLY